MIMNRLLLATGLLVLVNLSQAMLRGSEAPIVNLFHSGRINAQGSWDVSKALTTPPGQPIVKEQVHHAPLNAPGSPPFDMTQITPLVRGEGKSPFSDHKGNYAPLYADTAVAADHKLIGVGDWHGDVAVAVETLVKNGILSPTCDENNWFSLVKYDVHPFFDQDHPTTFAPVLPKSYVEDKAGSATGTCTWTANNTIVVSTGDFLDRGPDTLKMLWFVGSLEKAAELASLSTEKAKGANTAYVQLLGNHELMNINNGFFRDVSVWDDQIQSAELSTTTTLADHRKAIFAPEHKVGKWVRSKRVIVRVADPTGDRTPHLDLWGIDTCQSRYFNAQEITSHETDKRKDKIDPSLKKIRGFDGTLWMRYDPHDVASEIREYGAHQTSHIGVFSATCGEVSFDAGTLENLVCKGSGGVIFTHGGFQYSTLATQVRDSIKTPNPSKKGFDKALNDKKEEIKEEIIKKGGQDVVDAINSLDKSYFMGSRHAKSVVWDRSMWFGQKQDNRGRFIKNERNPEGQLAMCSRIKESVQNVLKASQVVLGHTRVCNMNVDFMPPGCKLKSETKGDGVMHCKCQNLAKEDVSLESGGGNDKRIGGGGGKNGGWNKGPAAAKESMQREMKSIEQKKKDAVDCPQGTNEKAAKQHGCILVGAGGSRRFWSMQLKKWVDVK